MRFSAQWQSNKILAVPKDLMIPEGQDLDPSDTNLNPAEQDQDQDHD
jgi:hypothetical protein